MCPLRLASYSMCSFQHCRISRVTCISLTRRLRHRTTNTDTKPGMQGRVTPLKSNHLILWKLVCSLLHRCPVDGTYIVRPGTPQTFFTQWSKITRRPEASAPLGFCPRGPVFVASELLPNCSTLQQLCKRATAPRSRSLAISVEESYIRTVATRIAHISQVCDRTLSPGANAGSEEQVEVASQC